MGVDRASHGHAGSPEQDESGQTSRARDRRHIQRSTFHARLHAHPLLALATKAVVTVIGFLVLVAGVVMIVTPGPAMVLIPLGLAILATEWEWARRLLRRVRDQAQRAQEKAAAMDPRVRRRRLLLAGVAVLLVVALVVGYVAAFDWPWFAVSGWNWVQSLAGWVPDLPAM